MIPILYEERGFLVCLKPPGLLSQSGPGDDLLQALSRQAGGSFLPVHRLDRGVGGVMAVARTKNAAAALSAAVAQRKFEKEYLCLVRGRPLEEAGTYRALLLHDRQRNKSFVVDRRRGGVKEAELEEKTGRPVIAVSAKEETGIDLLEKQIQEMFYHGELDFNEEVLITNVRHKTALANALASLHMVKQGILDQMPEDFLTIDLMDAYGQLGIITGESVEDDLVNEIFSKFCMGK